MQGEANLWKNNYKGLKRYWHNTFTNIDITFTNIDIIFKNIVQDFQMKRYKVHDLHRVISLDGDGKYGEDRSVRHCELWIKE